MQDFKKLAVWQRSHNLALRVYAATASFSRDEQFGVTSQLRRAATSIPANIAEGCGRNGNTEFARFLHIAAGSASELEYHLLLVRDLGYLTESSYTELSKDVVEVKRMLVGLLRRLRLPTEN